MKITKVYVIAAMAVMAAAMLTGCGDVVVTNDILVQQKDPNT